MKSIYNFKDIKIQLTKKNIKNIYLRVKPDGIVTLSIPYNLSNEKVYNFLLKKEDWIKNSLDYFKYSKKLSYKNELQNDDTIKYLGRNYKIKIYRDTKEYIKLINNYAEIHLINVDDFKKENSLLMQWYLNEATKIFPIVMEKYCDLLKETYSKLSIKNMKSIWGSCNPIKRNINLNLQLIKKPMECIEYVVLHELAHLKYPNHSKDFWNYVSIYMSDWKEKRNRLKFP